MLDFTTSTGVAYLGHCHPAFTKTARFQVAKAVHDQINIAFHKPLIDIIQSLIPLMPHPSVDTLVFLNSGAEAVEAAVKITRHATRKQNTIVM